MEEHRDSHKNQHTLVILEVPRAHPEIDDVVAACEVVHDRRPLAGGLALQAWQRTFQNKENGVQS